MRINLYSSKHSPSYFKYLFFCLFLLSVGKPQLWGQNCSVNAGVDQNFCYTYQMELDGNASNLNIVEGSVLWQVVSQPVGASAIIDDVNAVYSTLSGTC